MRITFESVSYSYSNPKTREKNKRRTRKLRAKGVAESPATLQEHGKADWGSDPDQIWALRDISFYVEEGEFLGIAGHTGSGKSTLIQHMNGLVKPTYGRVLLDGVDLASKQAAQDFRGKVGLVFQYPEHQLFAATVNEDVSFGPKNLGLSQDEIDKRVCEALTCMQFDPEEVGHKSPFELSGGQQRRVAFAGILAMEPQVLILDEPVAGLDPVAREEFLDLISTLHTQGLTIVMVSHNMEDLARLSDRILVLNEGAQFDLGTPEHIFNQAEELRAIGLDVPAPQKLASELQQHAIPLEKNLYTLDELADDIAALYHKALAPEETHV